MIGFFIKQWMEKKPNGIFIFRNDRAEDREARKHSNSNHKSMDLLISKVQTQFENEMEGRICTCFFLFSFTLHFFEVCMQAYKDHKDQWVFFLHI